MPAVCFLVTSLALQLAGNCKNGVGWGGVGVGVEGRGGVGVEGQSTRRWGGASV